MTPTAAAPTAERAREALAPPRPPDVPRGARRGLWATLRFWARVALETVGARRLSRVLEQRLRGRGVLSSGLEHVPARGPFVLALNHGHAHLTVDLIAAAVLSAEPARTDARLADEVCLVVGRRPPRASPSRWRRLLRATTDRVLRAWEARVLALPALGAEAALAAGLAQLRAFRRVAGVRPVLVFPEGVARGAFGDIRAGAGRWLGGLAAPTVPVAVWWSEPDDAFRVVVGARVAWAPRAELRDLQLGLAIAALLPESEAPEWQALLARWRGVHAASGD